MKNVVLIIFAMVVFSCGKDSETDYPKTLKLKNGMDEEVDVKYYFNLKGYPDKQFRLTNEKLLNLAKKCNDLSMQRCKHPATWQPKKFDMYYLDMDSVQVMSYTVTGFAKTSYGVDGKLRVSLESNINFENIEVTFAQEN